MTSVLLGRTGLRVPPAVLGTATFGLQTDEDASREILDKATSSGLYWLDTSTSYPLGSGPEIVGVTESILGRWLGHNRDSYVISTKVYNRTGDESWRIGLSRKHILSAVEGSLRRLGTDYIDILQLHRYDEHTPLEESLSTLSDLVRDGKVRYVGCCNFLGHQIARSASLSREHGWPVFHTAQVRYNLLMRGPEIEIIPACQDNDIAVLPFNLLAGGLLTGKHDRRRGPAKESRFAYGESGERYVSRYWSHDNFDTIEELSKIAGEVGVSLVTLAIAWAMQRHGVTVPLIGVSRASQLDAILDAIECRLDKDVVLRVNDVTSRHRRYIEEVKFESS